MKEKIRPSWKTMVESTTSSSEMRRRPTLQDIPWKEVRTSLSNLTLRQVVTHFFLITAVISHHTIWHMIGLVSRKTFNLSIFNFLKGWLYRFLSDSTLCLVIHNTVYQLVKSNQLSSHTLTRNQRIRALPNMGVPDHNKMDTTIELAHCMPEKPTEGFPSKGNNSISKIYFARKRCFGSAQYFYCHSSATCPFFMTTMSA